MRINRAEPQPAAQFCAEEPFVTDPSVTSLHPALSPDGKWIAYIATDPGGQATVFVQPFPPTGARYRIDSGINPLWAADGRTLFTATPGGSQFFGHSLRIGTGVEPGQELLKIPRPAAAGSGPNSSRQYDVSPDGEHFIMAAFSADSGTRGPLARRRPA